MTQKVIFFDVMNTLVVDPFYDAMPGFFGMSFEEMLVQKDPTAWVDFELGNLDETEFLNAFFADRRGFDHAAFKRCVREAYGWLDGVVPMLEELRSRNVPMFALSNYPIWFAWIEDALELKRYFSSCYVSHRMGVRKPNEAAFSKATELAEVDTKSCIFIDDSARNCEAALRFGMDAIVSDRVDWVRASLVRRGVL